MTTVQVELNRTRWKPLTSGFRCGLPESALWSALLLVGALLTSSSCRDDDDPTEVNCPSTARAALRGDIAIPFVRGDIDTSDPIGLLDYLFVAGTPEITCQDAGDANDDGILDTSDAVFLLLHLFAGFTAPPAPFPDCGTDGVADDLGCESFRRCEDPGGCLTQADLKAIVRTHLPPELCLAAGGFRFAGPLAVAICPESVAETCAASGRPGCAIQLDVVDCELDRAGSEIRILVEGQVTGLPLTIQASGLETLCRADIGFMVGGAVPLILSSTPGGGLEVVDIGEPRIGEITTSLAATGGILCDAFALLEDDFVAAVRRLLLRRPTRRIEELRAESIGREICLDE